MPKLSTETTPIDRDRSIDAKDITRVAVQRLQPAYPAEDTRTGSVIPFMGYIDNNASKFVKTTPEICARIIGEVDEAGAGFSDPLYMANNKVFFVGLITEKTSAGGSEDICVRLDSATIPPETPTGVKTDSENKNNEYYVRFDEITESYDVERAPRGTPINDVLVMLNLLDSKPEIKAGLQLNRSLRVVAVNPPYITISRPPVTRARMTPGR